MSVCVTHDMLVFGMATATSTGQPHPQFRVHMYVSPMVLFLPEMVLSSMSDVAAGSAINARASWLAGRPVHGDVLLSYTKIRHTRWLVPAVVASSDFTEEVYWQWLHGLLPEVDHVDRGAHSLISRLPKIYRCGRLVVGACIASASGD